MTVVDQTRPHQNPPGGLRSTSWWLLLSVPIAGLAGATSLAGILVDRVYAEETPHWEAQAVGQDVANLVVLPLMLVFAYAAARGSVRALLGWAGTVVYTAYGFAIYAFAVHFGPLFLVYVAVLGLAAWALFGFFASLPLDRIEVVAPPPLTLLVSTFLIAVAAGFALLWLSLDLPAMITGEPSAELKDNGLGTNPVHVLDLALFLPTALVAGILLRRGLPWGQLLAPIVLVAMAGISLGIVSLTIVAAARDLDASPAVAVVVGALGLVQAELARRLLRGAAAVARG